MTNLFKSWFIDFDPVIDNAILHGKPIPDEFADCAEIRRQILARNGGGEEGMPGALPSTFGRGAGGEGVATCRDLFPDCFQDSPLGKIPEGWEVKSLGEVLSLEYGKALKSSIRNPGDVPVYGSNGQIGWHDDALVDGPGIVVGRKGNPGTVTWAQETFFPIDTTFYVKPKSKEISLRYLYHALLIQSLPALSADSAVPGLNRNIAYENKLLLAPISLLAAFERLCVPLQAAVQASYGESEDLSQIRDTLLPRLLSGTMEVKRGD